jgi:glycosyltransferase involved in cell wall biosynthesis
MQRRCVFVLPGSWHRPTGGCRYDRRVGEGLRERGWAVDLLSLDDSFPAPTAAALDDAEAAVAALPDGVVVVADGLAFGALPEVAERHAERLRWVALVHHPLALETGLSAARAGTLFDSECRALAFARRIVTPSEATARDLAPYGVARERIDVVEPGTDPAPLARGSGTAAPSLLCVASLTPRKGHRVLVEALAGLRDRDWTLHLVGSTDDDPPTAAAVREAVAAEGLVDRVVFHGTLDSAGVQARLAVADLFVLPSFHEGYGMALAEALACGLPVVACRAGAVVDTVPADAGVLVPPGDATALRHALARLLDDSAAREALAGGARAARRRLPTWDQAVDRFATVLDAA